MNSLSRLLILLVLVAFVAASACWTTSRFLKSDVVHPISDHRWLHAQLGITEEQDKELDKEEDRFALQRKDLVETIRQANAELATTMVHEREYSPQVQAAVEKVHHAQSALEEATLQHIFAMKPILTPSQFDKLLTLTSEALNSPSDR